MENEIKYKENYERMKQNSIGSDKKCQDKRKKVILNSSIAAIILTFTLTCFAGVNMINNKIQNKIDELKEYQSETQITAISDSEYILGYKVLYLKMYAKSCANNLLLEHNFKALETKNGRRTYNYIAEDYRKIEELNEEYIYGFYNLTDKQTLEEVCIALGYEGFKDYLIKNNYVTEDGKEDIINWEKDNLNSIANYMIELKGKGKTK